MHKNSIDQISFRVDAAQKERFCYSLAALGHSQNWMLTRYIEDVVEKFERTYGSITDDDIREWRETGKARPRRLKKTATDDMSVAHSSIVT